MFRYIKKAIPEHIRNNIKAFINYCGFTYKCNFCYRSFKKFLPIGSLEPVVKEKKMIGAGSRLCICPVCYSSDRERLILLYLKDEAYIFKKPKNTKLLHIAPEKNLARILLNITNIEYIAGDKFEKGYIYSNDTMYLDVNKLPFLENEFDIILCNHVFEHIPDDRSAMSEVYRVMKKNGWGIFQVPISINSKSTFEDNTKTTQEQKQKYFGQSDHVRIYGMDYKERLSEAGFVVKVRNLAESGKEKEIKKYGINPLEDLYIAYK